jgi:hypothetical protein
MKTISKAMPGVFLTAGLLLSFTLLPAQAATNAFVGAAPAGYSAASLFNQANADARQGKVGEAVLNYERARLLAPGDAAIAANLRHVRTEAGLPDPEESGIVRRLTALPPNLLAWLGCGGILLVGVSLLARRLRPRRPGRWNLATAIGVLFVAAAVGDAVLVWPQVHAAVVVVAATSARISPAALAEPTFQLRAGETVTIQSAHADFLLVTTAAGRTGWVARTDLGRVVPDPA